MTQLTLAGTAALAGSSASAQVTVVNVNENIGFAPGDQKYFISSLPGNAQFQIFRGGFLWGALSHPSWYVGMLIGDSTNLVHPGFDHGAIFKTVGNLDDVLPAGKKWSTIGGPTNTGGLLNVNANFSLVGGVPTVPTYADQYLAFGFPDPVISGQTDYGWVEVSLTNNSASDMTILIESVSYSLSGSPFAAGNVPEPSPAVALVALSALPLGAVGVRRMKALRAAA